MFKNKPNSPSTGPWISELSNPWRQSVQPNITCKVLYYCGKYMTFTWELVRRNGNVITLPGYNLKRYCISGRSSYNSALNYSLPTDDIQSMLRCIARVDDETHRSYKAKAGIPIPSYGTCDDKVPENINEIWCLLIQIMHQSKYLPSGSKPFISITPHFVYNKTVLWYTSVSSI